MRRALGLALVLVVVTATPSLAHVTVHPSEVTEGSFATLTFRVPNESDTASTTSLEIVLPEGAPFRSVSVKPTPGWSVTVDRDGDTLRGITWEGGEIAPGEFQEFDISVAPVPEVEVLEFKAVQTHSDGEVVRWIDPVIEGDEADHPAPTATVVEGEGTGDHGEAADASDGEDGTDPVTFAALFAAGVALMAAVAALIFARVREPA